MSSSDSCAVAGSAAFLADDIPCIHCDYNLRGLMPGGRCPECGHEIAPSLAEHARWKDLPRQFGPMRKGLWMLVISQAVWLVAVPYTILRMRHDADRFLNCLVCLSGNRPWAMSVYYQIGPEPMLVIVVGAGSLALQCWGAWLVTQAVFPEERLRRRGRLLLRHLIIASAALLALATLFSPFFKRHHNGWEQAIGVLLMIDLPVSLLMAFRFRKLARRLRLAVTGRLLGVFGCGIAAANVLVAIDLARYLVGDPSRSRILLSAGATALAAFNLLWLVGVAALARAVGRGMSQVR